MTRYGGYPNSPDAKKAIKKLEADGRWTYDTTVGGSAHKCGTLRCGDGCAIVVWKTGKNTARAIWSAALRCTHGSAPLERKP